MIVKKKLKPNYYVKSAIYKVCYSTLSYKQLVFYVYPNTPVLKKNDSNFVLFPLKRWEVNTYLVDNLRQPPGPSQTKHQQIHNYPFETDDFVERQIRNSFFRRYAIFFIKLNGFVIFILVWISRKWKKNRFLHVI